MSPEATPHPDVFAEDVRRTRRRGIGAGLLTGAVIVVVAILLLTLLGRCDGDETAAPTATPSVSGTGAPVTTATTPAPEGLVTADGQVLVPLSGPVSLGGHAGQEASAEAVPVQSVPSDEGFWVGTADDDRVWVQLTVTQGESPFVVKGGQKVAFRGEVVPNGTDFADRIGLTAAEGAPMLAAQGFHVAVARADLRLLP